jgi:hypothetical protein
MPIVVHCVDSAAPRRFSLGVSTRDVCTTFPGARQPASYCYVSQAPALQARGGMAESERAARPPGSTEGKPWLWEVSTISLPLALNAFAP